MNEFHVLPSDINDQADMCYLSSAFACCEEHQVAGLKVSFFDLLSHFRLIFGRSGQGKVDRLEGMDR